MPSRDMSTKELRAALGKHRIRAAGAGLTGMYYITDSFAVSGQGETRRELLAYLLQRQAEERRGS